MGSKGMDLEMPFFLSFFIRKTLRHDGAKLERGDFLKERTERRKHNRPPIRAEPVPDFSWKRTDANIKIKKERIPGKSGNRYIYGIFYFCNQHFTDARGGNRSRTCRVGRDQPSGRLWQ